VDQYYQKTESISTVPAHQALSVAFRGGRGLKLGHGNVSDKEGKKQFSPKQLTNCLEFALIDNYNMEQSCQLVSGGGVRYGFKKRFEEEKSRQSGCEKKACCTEGNKYRRQGQEGIGEKSSQDNCEETGAKGCPIRLFFKGPCPKTRNAIPDGAEAP